MAGREQDSLFYLLDQIAAQVDRHRRQGDEEGRDPIERCAVGFRFTDADPPRELTLLIDAAVTVLDGVIAPPGLPHVTLSLSGTDFLSLLRGKVEGDHLLAAGQLRIEGRADLFAALTACFPEGKNWLSVRL